MEEHYNLYYILQQDRLRQALTPRQTLLLWQKILQLLQDKPPGACQKPPDVL